MSGGWRRGRSNKNRDAPNPKIVSKGLESFAKSPGSTRNTGRGGILAPRPDMSAMPSSFRNARPQGSPQRGMLALTHILDLLTSSSPAVFASRFTKTSSPSGSDRPIPIHPVVIPSVHLPGASPVRSSPRPQPERLPSPLLQLVLTFTEALYVVFYTVTPCR